MLLKCEEAAGEGVGRSLRTTSPTTSARSNFVSCFIKKKHRTQNQISFLRKPKSYYNKCILHILFTLCLSCYLIFVYSFHHLSSYILSVGKRLSVKHFLFSISYFCYSNNFFFFLLLLLYFVNEKSLKMKSRGSKSSR